MAARQYVFDPPDRFVAGAIGEPGARTFFLQARKGRRIVSVSLDKSQVAVLAERLGALILELERRGLAEASATAPVLDEGPLDEPLNEVFRAGSLTLGWDGDDDLVLVEAQPLGIDDDDEDDEEIGGAPIEIGALTEDDEEEDDLDVFRVRMSADAARGFVERAMRVVRAGRPLCPLCGNPLDAQGHVCPRKNGHYVH